MATRLHLPHAIEKRLHVHKIDVVILTPETAGSIGVLTVTNQLLVGFAIKNETMNVARSTPLVNDYHAGFIYVLES